MSTQFDTPIMDLDRTDELPVLDVEAYEASLAAREGKLSRTDTWAVQGLHAIDALDKELKATVPPATAKPSGPAEALTTNVEQILKRIAELEAEIVSTHQSNDALLKDCETFRAEGAAKSQRFEALRVEHARLSERCTQSETAALRLEMQLCERADFIASLEKTLRDEKVVAARLSQQLAAKMMDCEKAESTVELRDRTIEHLTHDGAELNRRLQEEMATGADLTARLEASERLVDEERKLLFERDGVIGTKDELLAQAQAQIKKVSDERDSLRFALAQLDARVTVMDARAADLEQKEAELAQLRGEFVAAQAEVQSQGKLLKHATDELATLRLKGKEHEATIRGFEHAIRLRGEEAESLMTELRAARDEQAMTVGQLDIARARTKTLTDQIFSRDNQIAALEAEIAVHMEALATIRRDVNRIGGRTATRPDEVEHTLEPVGHDGPTLNLTREVLTIGRTSDNDIVVPSKLISRRHARLLVGPTGVIIEDAGSMNGCYVNGDRIRQHLLHEGDVLELGDLRYRLRTGAKREVTVPETNLRQLTTLSRKAGPRIAH